MQLKADCALHLRAGGRTIGQEWVSNMCDSKGTYDSDELHVADHVFVAFTLLSETCEINTIFTGTHLENLKITTKIDKVKQKIHFASYFY
jgi:hypothetical protein